MFHALVSPLPLLFVAAVLPVRLAQADLVIDDFTDIAEIRLPDGPDQVTTEGVGDLNASRLLKFRPVGPGVRTARADVGISVPGEYTTDVDDADRILFVDAEYTFELFDFTQGGINDAFFVDFTFAEGVITVASGHELQPPSGRLLALSNEQVLLAEFSNSVTAPFPQHEAPYTMVIPLNVSPTVGVEPSPQTSVKSLVSNSG